mmetsp:Transcript_42222/g.90693  ORF Transcript_42222/g.90693 Transcript_42222/m.90693 type:complete len:138 (+) Transcript_42222:71-484(+)
MAHGKWEANMEHLSLSRDLYKTVSERKLRMTAEGWLAQPPLARTSQKAHARDLEKSLTRSRSEPGKTFAPGWSKSHGSLLASSTSQSIFVPPKSPAGTSAMAQDCGLADQVAPWNKPLRWHTSQCISRTAGGGFWAR